MEKFVLVDGYVSLNNEQIFVDINSFKRDLKQRGGWLGVFLAFLGISLFHNIKEVDYFKSFFNYFDFGLRIIGVITIICIIIYMIFFFKSKKNLLINDITKIQIDKILLESDVILYFSKRKRIVLTFRNLEKQIDPFIEAIKKRNTRVKIEYN